MFANNVYKFQWIDFKGYNLNDVAKLVSSGHMSLETAEEKINIFLKAKEDDEKITAEKGKNPNGETRPAGTAEKSNRGRRPVGLTRSKAKAAIASRKSDSPLPDGMLEIAGKTRTIAGLTLTSPSLWEAYIYEVKEDGTLACVHIRENSTDEEKPVTALTPLEFWRAAEAAEKAAAEAAEAAEKAAAEAAEKAAAEAAEKAAAEKKTKKTTTK